MESGRILPTFCSDSTHVDDIRWRGQSVDLQYDPYASESFGYDVWIAWSEEIGDWAYVSKQDFFWPT